ncbi:PTS sugar transporter subunit IIC [Amphibacillus sediminis]|uniref:PTS sugar transporter subunit IIC n=1 Tax=Amphibacillus sediminis TaxID=360185 RepID=UPI00082F2AF2|nr:PTS transporter subunit EIIC [Amphibacillus sediminis]
MGEKTQNFQAKIQRVAGKIGENKYLKAVSNGLMSTLPVMIIGSLATLFANLNFEGYQNLIESAGIKSILTAMSTMTIDIVALYAVFFIAFKLASNLGEDGSGAAGAGLISLISFMVLMPIINTEDIRAIPFQYLGAQGLFVAIIVGLISARIYMVFINKAWTIKLPDAVPPTVSKTFAGLMPAIVIVIMFAIVGNLFERTEYGSIYAFIYTLIQSPMQKVGGSFGALILVLLVMQILWFFGIHGRLVVNPVFLSVWMPLGVENLNAINAGLEPTNIVHTGFYAVLIGIGGAGATLGLCILMTFFSKSKQFRTLGKLALPGTIFGINEPLIFGTPLILNPIMFIPFVFAPIILASLSYFIISIGVFPILNGTHIAIGTPMIMNALLQGSGAIVILQLINTVISVIIYYPFFKIMDKKAQENEQSSAA